MSRYSKAAQAGQLPLLVPDSSWTVPTSLPDWRGRPFIAVDTETKDEWLAAQRGAGWAVGAGRICGVSAAVEGEAIYIPIAHPDTDCFPKDNVARWVDDHFRSGSKIVMQKATYDVGWLRSDLGVDSPQHLDDTMIMQYMIDENRLEYGLDSICRTWGIPGKDESLLREAAATYGVDPKAELWRLPARYVGRYAEVDASQTLAARHKMWPTIVEEDTVDAYQLEIDLIPLVVEMRMRGIRVDMDYADELRETLRRKTQEVLDQLTDRIPIGRAVTMKDVRQNSFKQRLFDQEGLPYPRTAGGAPSFESKTMVNIDHWLPKLLVQAQKFNDAGEKFVGNYIQGYAHMGRIHAEIHTTKDREDDEGPGGGTSTTRLAYSDPPLQQQPSRDPYLGPAIRKCFLPEIGHKWGAIDFSQQEFRLIVSFAYLCQIKGAEDAVKKYQEDPHADFHNIVVELTGLPRRTAKDVNFARAFRAGAAKFALMINKPLEEAKAIYDQYDDRMPFVSRFAEFCDSRAQKRGYLRLIDGARAHFDRYEPRWIPKDKFAEGVRNQVPMHPCSLQEAQRRCKDPEHSWYNERLRRAFTFKALNRLIQGSAARQTKIAMRDCWRAGIVPLVQLHDELGVSCPDMETAKKVALVMQSAVKLAVPVTTDIEIGTSWGTAKYAKWEEAV